MDFSLLRRVRAVLSVPFVTGLLIGGLATGTAGAALRGSAVFSDVPSGSYYDTAVGELNAAGIIKGSNGRFNPSNYVTRAEVAVMMNRLRQELKGLPIDDGASAPAPSPSPEPTPAASSSSRSSRSKSSSSVSSSSSVASSASSYNPKGTMRFTTTNFTAGEQLGKVNVSVVRTGGNDGSAAINYTMTSGTAAAGTDFVAASGTLVFSNKETSKTFSISFIDDILGEGNETFTITLTNPQFGVSLGTPSTATVTIQDNETTGSSSSTGQSASVSSGPAAGTLSFSADMYSMQEKGSPMTITVTRTGGTTGTVGVAYATANGTGNSGSDYTSTNGTLSFGPGETSKTFTVIALDNSSVTGNKSFVVQLSNVTGGAILGTVKQAQVTIFDDESTTYGSGSLKFSKSSYTATRSQGEVLITVHRTGGSSGTVSVAYSTTSGTASSGVEYNHAQGTLTFAPGEASKSFAVTLLKGTSSGGERTVNLNLGDPTGGATLVTPYTAVLTIFQ